MDKIRRKLSLGGKGSSGKEKKTTTTPQPPPPQVSSSSSSSPALGNAPIAKKRAATKESVPIQNDVVPVELSDLEGGSTSEDSPNADEVVSVSDFQDDGASDFQPSNLSVPGAVTKQVTDVADDGEEVVPSSVAHVEDIEEVVPSSVGHVEDAEEVVSSNVDHVEDPEEYEADEKIPESAAFINHSEDKESLASSSSTTSLDVHILEMRHVLDALPDLQEPTGKLVGIPEQNVSDQESPSADHAKDEQEVDLEADGEIESASEGLPSISYEGISVEDVVFALDDHLEPHEIEMDGNNEKTVPVDKEKQQSGAASSDDTEADAESKITLSETIANNQDVECHGDQKDPAEDSIENDVAKGVDERPRCPMQAANWQTPSLRLEESVKYDNNDEHSVGTSNSVSAQIREIVTRHLSTEDLSDAGVSSKPENLNALKDENRTLHHELDRVEDLLAATRAEREEIGIKYNALSERLDQLLQDQRLGCDGSDEEALKALLNQNVELRRRIEDEHRSFQKRIHTYHDGQKQQAHLVQRLQMKVIQYKQKCDNLEMSVTARHKEMDESRARTTAIVDRIGSVEAHLTSVAVTDFESALNRLDEEKNRCDNLVQVNSLLREQLEAVSQANQSLASDVQKVTQDWQAMREELEAKESEWRDEEQAFNEYFMAEHDRLLSLWRDTAKFRREFGDMKTSTERDLSKLRLDFSKLANELKNAFAVTQQQQRLPPLMGTSEQVLPDFDHISGHLLNHSENIINSMSPSELWRRIQEVNLSQVDVLAERSELLSRFEQTKSAHDQLKLKLDEKEHLISSLKRNLHEMTSGKESLEKHVSAASSLRNENRFLHKALGDISNQVLKEVDGFDIDRDRDERDGRVGANLMAGLLNALGHSSDVGGGDQCSGSIQTASTLDSIVSIIQSSLNKRSMQIEELSGKLASSKDHYTMAHRKYEDCIEHGRQMEREIQKLKSQVDSDMTEKCDLKCENERFKMKFNALNEEKEQLERLKQSLVTQIQELNSENEKLRDETLEGKKNKEAFSEERETLLLEADKQRKEIEINQKTLSTLESKLVSVKDELVTIKETLNKTVLTKDIVILEKKNLEENFNHSEKRRRTLEVEVSRLKATEMSLHDIILKLHGDSEMTDQEKNELNSINRKLSDEKFSLSADLAELEQEKIGLREEVLRLEQDKLSLLEEKTNLQEALSVAGRTHMALQDELDRHAHEKRELNSQLGVESRTKASLADDVVRLSRELERQMLTQDTIIREKERLTKEKADLAVRLETTEREFKSSSEVLAELRAQKSNLEMSLYEAQQSLDLSESRRTQLESEKTDGIEKKQYLQAQVSQLLKDLEAEKSKLDSVRMALENRLMQSEQEHSTFVERIHREHKATLESIYREKEAAKQRLEASHQEMLQKFTTTRNEASSKQEGKIEALRQQLDAAHRDFQQRLTIMEQDKEMVLVSLRKEKTKLHEQVQLLKKDLLASQTTLDKEKREAASKSDVQKTAVDDLHVQLRNLKTQMEDASMTHEKALKDMRNQLQEANQQREFALQEVNGLRGKMQLAEESRDFLKNELAETVRKLKDAAEKVETLKSDNTKLNCDLNGEKQEKNSVEKTNEELLNKLKRLESEKGEMKRYLEESFEKISIMESASATGSKEVTQLRELLREMEKSRLDLRKELQSHRRQLKTVDEGMQAKSQEIHDLTNRIARDDEKEDNNRKEIISLKQKLSESEADGNALRKDLANVQRQLSESGDVNSVRVREFQQSIQEAERKERQLDEHRRRLEGMLEVAGVEAGDLKLQLSDAEGKVGALQVQLHKLEGSKKEAEYKLTSIHSSLRRYIGMRAESSKSKTPAKFSPLKSKRTSSPSTGTADGVVSSGITELNPEAIRNTLRDVMQQIQTLEMEKEESALQIGSLKERLSDVQSEKERIDEKLVQAQSSLGKVQQANQSSASQLMSVQKVVSSHQETISRFQKEQNTARETIDTFEQRIRSLETEATQYVDKLGRLQQSESRLELENGALREALTQVEGKHSQADKARRNLEAEVQRLQLSITDKDTECQVLSDRSETFNRRFQDAEEKFISLQVTIDRLNLALERSAEDESDLKDKLQNLNKSLTESASSSWSLQEKIHQLQKALANSENERRATQERLENTKQTSNETKKSNLAISERVQQLRAELSNYEERCRSQEKQVRSCEKLLGEHNENDQQNLQQIQKLQQEKHVLQNTVAELQRSLAKLEVERQDFQRWHVLLEKDKSALKQTLDKVERERLLSEELVSRSSRERNKLDTSFSTIQKDNDDLQRRLQELEGQLDEQERRHSDKLLGLTTRHRQEKDNEMDRLRNAQVQAERTLELRERAHRQRVLGLEQQVQLLKDQLNQEIRKRQIYVQQSVQAGNQMKDLRHTLDESLKTVSRQPTLDTLLLEHEARKLDNAVDRHLSMSGRSPALRRPSPVRPPLLLSSAAVSTSTPANRIS